MTDEGDDETAANAEEEGEAAPSRVAVAVKSCPQLSPTLCGETDENVVAGVAVAGDEEEPEIGVGSTTETPSMRVADEEAPNDWSRAVSPDADDGATPTSMAPVDADDERPPT